MKRFVNMNRRTLLSLTLVSLTALAAGCIASRSTGTGPSFKGPVGLQLYSLRAQFTRNVPTSIELVKSYGIQEVELAGAYNLAPEKFRAMLLAKGLQPVSGHFPFDRYRTNAESVALEAKQLGLRYAGIAWIPHNGTFSNDDATRAIEVFNEAGAVLAKHGIQFFYHPHGYEFQPQGDATLLDRIIRETNPKHVAFEMDTLWVYFPGQDPVAWLQKYPTRWQLMHLKDLNKGVARGDQSGKTDPNNDVALGRGQLDWPAILKAAKKTAIKHYFIEDESAASVSQIRETLDYLESVRF